jgi:hypothetical protein
VLVLVVCGIARFCDGFLAGELEVFLVFVVVVVCFFEGDDDDGDGKKYLREFREIKKCFEMKKKLFKYEKIILRWKN